MMNFSRRFFGAMAATALSAAVLTACGGGDATAPSATVSGVAATGAAIVSGTVTLKCVSGATTSATTGADGSFSIDVSGVTLPCLGRVDYKDAGGGSQQLYTIITSAGTANITPITDLIVASLSSGSAASAFDNFTATIGKTYTAATVKTAADAVKAYLTGTLGVDTSNLPGDPVGTPLTAKAGTTDGDKVDKILDDLKAKLGLRKLTEVEAAVAKGATSSSNTSTGAVGCTGDAATFFASQAGSYPTTAQTYGGTGTVAGVANGGSATVVVAANCAVTVGDSSLSYQDGSYSSGGGQVDVSLTGTNYSYSSYEVFADGTGLVSLHDTRTNSYMNFFVGKK